MAGVKIRKGDTVQVISGKDKGTTGRVLVVDPETQRVIVEGVNRVVKHTKVGQGDRGAKTGGLIHTEAPIHVSNVALIDPDGKPSVRIVLCRGMDEHGLVFYTNRESRKGEALRAHPRACANFHWDRLDRQIRVEGTVTLTTEEYDRFTRLIYKDWPWLEGRGGDRNGIRQVVAITAPERETLYANPEGYSYARYIGMATTH